MVTWQPATITYTGTRLTWSLWSYTWVPAGGSGDTGAHARARGSGHPALPGAEPLALGPVLAESTERDSR